MKLCKTMFIIYYVALVSAIDGILQFNLQYSNSIKHPLKSLYNRGLLSEQLENRIYGYTISVGIGNPPKNVELLVDTSSQASLVMTQKVKIKEPIPVSPAELYDIDDSYSSGPEFGVFEASHEIKVFLSGSWTYDTFRMSGTKPFDLTFGLVKKTNFGLQANNRLLGGILGLGIEDRQPLEYGDGGAKINNTNIPNELKKTGAISYRVYSIWLNAYNREVGTLIFGAIDHSLISGDLYRFPLVPLLHGRISHFAIKMSALYLVHPGNWQELWAEVSTAVIFDTGFSVSMLPKYLLSPLLKSFDAKKVNGEWVVECDKLSHGGGIGILFSGVEFVFPFKDIVKISPFCKKYCIPGFKVGEFAIIGDNMIRSLYVVYDLEHNELGLALANTMSFGSPNYKKISTGIPGTSAPLYESIEMDHRYTTYEIRKFSVQTPNVDENGNIRLGMVDQTGIPEF